MLTAVELQTIIEKKLPTERLELVRDIFIFCCFIGLAYIDIQQLKRKEIGIGVDGDKWFFTSPGK